jgi:hypothetical protein
VVRDRLGADPGVRVGQRPEHVVVVLEQVGVDRPDGHAVLVGVLGQQGVVLDLVPRDVQRHPGCDAGVPVHLAGVGDLLERVARHPGLREHLEPGAGVAERPARELDGLGPQRGQGVLDPALAT